MIEILAPCGGTDVLPAALNTGADAVYLGVTAFSARRNAKNFTPDELKEAVKTCRLYGTKVYVTLNTLVFDEELDALRDTAELLEEVGVDAVIVQDLGAAEIIRETAPSLKLHASTQMTVCSPSGAEFCRKHGFSRVVLAREMSMKEIESVTRNVDIETEVFVHGALCVCVSGQCLMSAMYGGRSGNRGLCAQPCRLDFTYGDRHSVLSLKDLSVIEKLPELEKIGVTSAKIEGRMKRPEYVAAAVSACRDILSGKMADTETLKAVFSRSGFTASYLNGSISDMQGVRTRDDVTAAAPALKKLEKLYEKPMKRHIVDIDITAEAGKPVTAAVKCGKISFSYTSDVVPEEARNRSIAPKEICERIGKMGGTVFEAGKITASAEEGIMISASGINAVRRGILDRISEILITKEGL